MRRRAWTPAEIVMKAGERTLLNHPKRGCDRCGTALGDMNEVEMAALALGRRLGPARGECPQCLGFHSILADYDVPLDPGVAAVPPLTFRLLCPGALAGAPISGCAAWEPCGCEPVGIDVPSVEWTTFLATRCPTSPTGEHRHLVDRDTHRQPCVAAPQVGTCEYLQVTERMPTWMAGALDKILIPGLYPVEIDMFDRDTLVFEFVEITPHQYAEVEQ